MTELSDDDILRAVREISACRLPMAARRARYASFAEVFPALFDMACDGRVEEDTLKLMLRMRKRVATNKMTGDEADTAVGVTLAKRFVEPTLSALPTDGERQDAPEGGEGISVSVSVKPEPDAKRARTT